jgi:hypothetical protein
MDERATRNRLLEQGDADWDGRRCSSPAVAPKMIYLLVLQHAADGIPLAATCGVLGSQKEAIYLVDSMQFRDTRESEDAPLCLNQ